jgi:hypothetical protein
MSCAAVPMLEMGIVVGNVSNRQFVLSCGHFSFRADCGDEITQELSMMAPLYRMKAPRR